MMSTRLQHLGKRMWLNGHQLRPSSEPDQVLQYSVFSQLSWLHESGLTLKQSAAFPAPLAAGGILKMEMMNTEPPQRRKKSFSKHIIDKDFFLLPSPLPPPLFFLPLADFMISEDLRRFMGF